MRDAILTALTVPAFTDAPDGRPDTAPPGKRAAVHAVALRALLSEAPGVLSRAERQLLPDWLDRLAPARSPGDPPSRNPTASRPTHSPSRAKWPGQGRICREAK